MKSADSPHTNVAVAELEDSPRYKCPRGGTGIHAWFRAMFPKGIRGSNPLGGICNGASAAFRTL